MANTSLSGQVGRVVGGRYRLVAPLGAGSSAQVYLADDVTLGRQVAVKMLQPALAADTHFLDRFHEEARTIASVSHPNIVVVHDSGIDGVPYLVTEFLAGGSLRGVLASGHRLTHSQALLVGLDACRGLVHAHGRGLVHRDLKPANILFGDDQRLRIADFGLARAIAETGLTEQDGNLVGTLRYIAPEQAAGRPVGPKADVYALALTLVEAVTGQVPGVDADPRSVLQQRSSGDLSVPEDLGPLRPAVERAGKLDVDERVDADEFAIALLAASERLTAPTPLPLIGALTESAHVAVEQDERTRVSPVAVPPGETADADPDGAPARSRRSRLRLALAAFIAFTMVAGVAAFLLLRSTGATIPEVIGTDIEDFAVLAEERGWVLDEKPTRVDGTRPGEIVSTDPEPGSRVGSGDTVVVLVSQGNTLTDRPEELVGRALSEVVVELERAGLAYSVTLRFDEDVPEDHVIGTDGDVEAELPKGTVVPLLVSRGPQPRTIPDFPAGATLESVQQTLTELRLVVEVAEVFSDDVPAGQVVSVAPPSGTVVPRDSTVVVEASKGPDLVVVPDLRGLRLDEAEQRLIAAGLVLGQDCCASRGRVIGSDPPAGEQARRGSAVNVFLAR